MQPTDPLYPAKKTISPGDEFTIRQFFLPIRLNGEEIWALLDTGAHVSILPKEVAGNVLTGYNSPVGNGTFPLARLVSVPYRSYELDFEIFHPIAGTIKELDILPYAENPSINAQLRGVEFQVPDYSWPEMAQKLNAESPMSIESYPLNYVILGLYGVLDQLAVSFVGDNSVSVGSIPPS